MTQKSLKLHKGSLILNINVLGACGIGAGCVIYQMEPDIKKDPSRNWLNTADIFFFFKKTIIC